jgi:alpha/beta superfamily hydrolase
MHKNMVTKIISSVSIALLVIFIIWAPLSLTLINKAYDCFGFREHVNYSDIKTAEDYGLSSTEHDLTTNDNIKIHIYEVDVESPKGIVIMLSGITQPSVTHFFGQAALVKQAGFASILVDARGHGQSSGNQITFGIRDIKDVKAVTDYIKQQPKYKDLPVIVMGVSMGGATAINAAATNEDIDGLIAISAFASWTDVCVDTMTVNNCPRIFGELMRPSIWLNGMINFGIEYSAIQPQNTIQHIGNKPVLLMHSTGDTQVPIQNYYKILANYVGEDITTATRDTTNHFFVNDNDISNPTGDSEYCELILTFLEKFL